MLDIVTGTAGLIPGLVALSDKGYEHAFTLAGICGEHLLDNRVVDLKTKRKAWAVQTKRPVSGFAHGNSGIAHSLLQLHKRTEQFYLYEAAIESFSFEQSLYRPDVMNWPAFRSQKQISMCSWCHGA